jgi:hypothetical protein
MLADRYLILYGGMGEKTIFNDWYLLDCLNMSWKQMDSDLVLPLNIHSSMVWSGGRGMLVVSEQISIELKKQFYLNKIYEFKIRNIHK